MDSDADEDFADALLVGGADDDRGSDNETATTKPKPAKKDGSGGGGFGGMGLLPSLNKAITRKGFKTPTPIQRKTIPVVLSGRDVVGMARTGSGKTAAFVIPLIQRLKAHTAKQGVRAVVLSPSRELALQTLKVVKELGKGTDLRTVLLVGGDSLEEHFAEMSRNPDIVVATPGRFLHIKVEMRLDLSTVEYIVFDEADRLFEMGFASQLTEILHTLPSTRQSLLFSATLPVSLVEFARAGLTDPLLVRLDADSKISTELESAFISVGTTDKEGVLLYLLSDVIKVDQASNPSGTRGSVAHNATIIFACTKHHVDYLASLLKQSGYRVSYVYGSLDQTARRQQVDAFKSGQTNILVVTDVAARGIDIPILANVINYDFPAQPKVFVHRVGRTARAGKRGWAYSLVRADDAPYLLDLQLFLGRRLVTRGTVLDEPIDYTRDMVVGALPRDGFDRSTEWVTNLLGENTDLLAQKRVAQKGEKLYLKTRTAAAADSVRRAKELVATAGWKEVTPLLQDHVKEEDGARLDLLKRVGNFRPLETVFEIGSRGGNEAASVMRTRRDRFVIDPQRSRPDLPAQPSQVTETAKPAVDEDLLATFAQEQSPRPKKRKRGTQSDFRDEAFMSHYVPNTSERAYDVTDPAAGSFASQARGVALDLVTDEGKDAKANSMGAKRWDSRKKRFVNVVNDFDGSRALSNNATGPGTGKVGQQQSKRFVTGESGVKIPASYRAGRFEAWRKSGRATRSQLANANTTDQKARLSGKFMHKQDKLPKMPDRARDDYEKQKVKYDKAKERTVSNDAGQRKAKSELKSAADIRKDRMLKQKRHDKNARPAKRRK